MKGKTILLVSLMLFFSSNIFSSSKSFVKVYYFHGPIRCHTCLQIENEIKMTLNQKFDKELKNKKIEFDCIDYVSDTSNNYEKQYNLENQALIIAKFENGKQVKWKNLDKIWKFTGNYDRMSRYISSEIKEYLK